ncbi:hypothetical protein ACWCPQ_04155 [Nocardia sp. NPDC001965]
MGTRTARRISVAIAGLAGLAAPAIALAPAPAAAGPGMQSPFGLFLHFGPYRNAPEPGAVPQADQHGTGAGTPGSEHAQTLEGDTATPGAAGSSAGPGARGDETAPGESTPPEANEPATAPPAAEAAPPGDSPAADNSSRTGDSANSPEGEAGPTG